MSENYPSINVNAYVGGDAYNYIINGTYATAFFVLSMGFTVTGTIFLIAGMSAKPDSADTLEASDDAPIVLPDPDVQAAAAAPESQPAPDNDYPVQ
jgi:hypothetical protein